MGQCCVNRDLRDDVAARAAHKTNGIANGKHVNGSVPPPPSPPADASRVRRRNGHHALMGAALCRDCPPGFHVEPRWLGAAEEVPSYQRRPFVLFWYRLEPPRLRHFWRWHNEVINMWTHLLAMVIMAIRVAQWLSSQDLALCFEWPRAFYVAGISSYMATSVGVFGISVTFHWRTCTGEKEFHCWNCLDQSACLVVVLMGFFAGIPIGYHCMPALKAFYCWTSVAVCTGSSAIVYTAKEGSPLQAKAITATAVWGMVPAIHWLFASPEGFAAIGWQLVATIICACTAATIYLKHIPECYAPGRFDLIGYSHQLWHIFIFFTIILYAGCLTTLLDLIDEGSFCVA